VNDTHKIFFFDGSTTLLLADVSTAEQRPQVDEGQVVWQSNHEIFLATCGSATLSIAPTPSPTQPPENDCITTQLTDSMTDIGGIDIDNGRIVWASWDGSDYEIFLYDIRTRTTTQLTDNTTDDGGPDIDGERIVWVNWDGTTTEIFLYDINTHTTTQLTNNTTMDFASQIDGEQIVWIQEDDHDFDTLVVYDILTGTLTQITRRAPIGEFQIDNGKVVWAAGPEIYSEIYLYDISSSTTTQLTDNTTNDWFPQINGSQIVWLSGDPGETIYLAPEVSYQKILLYDIYSQTTTQLTDDITFDYGPQIDNGRVIWWGGNARSAEIFLFDINTGTTTQITNNTTADDSRQIDGEQIVWWGGTDFSRGIFLYDITTGTTVQLTSDTMDYPKAYLRLQDGQVIWMRNDGNGNEIFLMTCGSSAIEPQ
jgi:beta propeller repeat protein